MRRVHAHFLHNWWEVLDSRLQPNVAGKVEAYQTWMQLRFAWWRLLISQPESTGVEHEAGYVKEIL